MGQTNVNKQMHSPKDYSPFPCDWGSRIVQSVETSPYQAFVAAGSGAKTANQVPKYVKKFKSKYRHLM